MFCYHQGFLGDLARGNILLDHSLKYKDIKYMYTDTIIDIMIILCYYIIIDMT